MNLYSDEVVHKRNQHPGWAVRFEDGSWQSGGHGWYRDDDAAMAERHETKEAADYNAKKCQEWHNDTMPYEIVPAWEPLAESLRMDVAQLKKANTITPSELYEIESDLEFILTRLKDRK